MVRVLGRSATLYAASVNYGTAASRDTHWTSRGAREGDRATGSVSSQRERSNQEAYDDHGPILRWRGQPDGLLGAVLIPRQRTPKTPTREFSRTSEVAIISRSGLLSRREVQLECFEGVIHSAPGLERLILRD